jgi:hypothetical protein
MRDEYNGRPDGSELMPASFPLPVGGPPPSTLGAPRADHDSEPQTILDGVIALFERRAAEFDC